MGRTGRFGSCDFTTPKKLVTHFDLCNNLIDNFIEYFSRRACSSAVFLSPAPGRIRILIVTADSVPIRPSGGPLLAVRQISDPNGNSHCDGTKVFYSHDRAR